MPVQRSCMFGGLLQLIVGMHRFRPTMSFNEHPTKTEVVFSKTFLHWQPLDSELTWRVDGNSFLVSASFEYLGLIFMHLKRRCLHFRSCCRVITRPRRPLLSNLLPNLRCPGICIYVDAHFAVWAMSFNVSMTPLISGCVGDGRHLLCQSGWFGSGL